MGQYRQSRCHFKALVEPFQTRPKIMLLKPFAAADLAVFGPRFESLTGGRSKPFKNGCMHFVYQ